MQAFRFISGRYRWISRVAAICLLLLIACPVTAPFASCDLFDTLSVAGVEEVDGGSKAVAQPALLDAIGISAVVVAPAVPLRSSTHGRRPALGPVTARTPLRL